MMHQKSIWTLLLVLLLLGACSTDSNEEATPSPQPAPDENPTTPAAVSETDADVPENQAEEAVTISFAVYDWEQGRYEDMIETFEEEHPEIKVKTVSINEVLELDPTGGAWPDDAGIRLASAADVVGSNFAQSAGGQELALDLTPFLEEDDALSPDDFYPGLLQQFQREGSTWALPVEANATLIFFDKDAFDEAGLDYPQAGWTWDDLLAAAIELTEREGDEVARWGYVEQSFNPLTFVQMQAGSLFDDATDPPTPQFEDPEVIEAARWYTDLYLEHEVSPYFPPPDPDSDEPYTPQGYQLIEEGKAAMWPEFQGNWQWRSQNANLGVVPFPVSGDNTDTTPVYAQGYSISSGTRKADAAWQWLVFLTEQGGRDYGFGGPVSLPARQSVAEASGFWDDIDEELARALRYVVDHAYQPPYTPGQVSGEAYQAFREAIIAVMDGEATVAEALAEAQMEAEAAIAEAQLSEEEATPAPEIVVAEPEAEAPLSEDAVALEFITSGGSFNLQSYRDLAEQFREANPDIVVEVKAPNFFDGPVEMADLASEADCFQWYPSLEDEESLAAILSLEPFLDADASLSETDFFPAALENYKRQGQLWGLPGELNVTVMEYNKDLFDDAGVAYPTVDWTTDDFLEKAVALTEGEDEETKQYGFVSQTFETSDLLLFLDRLGANLVDESSEPPAFDFTNPDVAEAVRWYTNLTTEYEVKPVFITEIGSSGGGAFQRRQTLLQDNRAAMWSSTGFDNIATFGEEEAGEERRIGVVPFPAGPDGGRRGSYQSGSGYFISAETEARQACWTWITFLSQHPTSETALPARRATAESAEYRQLVGEERAAAYLASIAEATEPAFFQRLTQENSWMGLSFFWLTQAYDQILNDGLTVEEALENAQETAETYRACIIAAEAFSDPEGQQACAQEADDSLPSYMFSAPDEDEDE